MIQGIQELYLFVVRWKIKVPIPAVKRAVAGSSPTSNGTKTVAPKATKRNCTPTTVRLNGDKFSCVHSYKLD